MNSLYPLKFKPAFKDKIWGGRKVQTLFGLDFSPLPNCGEVWLLSGVPGEQSIVSEGFLEGNELNELIEVYMEDLVGDLVYERFGEIFPILVKLIDSNDFLSIQVHPDDELAMKRHGGSGKTEMWYIIDAEKDASLISGFNRPMNKETYLRALEEKRIPEIMNSEKVSKGDVFFTPAGRVHALGPGMVLAEIQQTSDITYRIYDWDRIDHRGMSRELHTEQALDAIDFSIPESYRTLYKEKDNGSVSLVKSPQFTTNLIQISKPLKKDYTDLDSFVIYLCTEGSCELIYPDGSVEIKAGECVLIPNLLDILLLSPKPMARILETYIV